MSLLFPITTEMICRICEQIIKSHESNVPCDTCRNPVHHKCVGLSESDIKMTRSKSKSVKIICNSCDKNLSVVSDIKSLTGSLRSEFASSLEDLKNTFQ